MIFDRRPKYPELVFTELMAKAHQRKMARTADIIAECLNLQALDIKRRERADDLAQKPWLDEALVPLVLLAINQQLHMDMALVNYPKPDTKKVQLWAVFWDDETDGVDEALVLHYRDEKDNLLASIPLYDMASNELDAYFKALHELTTLEPWMLATVAEACVQANGGAGVKLVEVTL